MIEIGILLRRKKTVLVKLAVDGPEDYTCVRMHIPFGF